MMDIQETIDKLASKKSMERRRAAKEIGKSQFHKLGDTLYRAYLNEINDKRTWETQAAMVTALGLINHTPAIKVIEAIVKINKPRDRITSEAATALIRLTRKSKDDATGIILLLEKGSYSVVTGALATLALDNMTPQLHESKTILKKAWGINKHKDRINHEYGLIDARMYVALACWNWDRDEAEPFLRHCIDTAYNVNKFNKLSKNKNLITVCENSLLGKISKGYI